jgi:hypothetical protein
MKGNQAKVLADTPNVDGSKSENRSLPERLPVRRIGLEQEFFLVDRRGAPRDLADPFLRECREAARAEGLDPRSFEAECAKGLVEIATQPSYGVEELAKEYLNNLHLALGIASELGLALYPLGTYPLPIRPALRDDPGYAIKASTIGYERFLGAGRCAGTHLHLELPTGTVWPDVKVALDAPLAVEPLGSTGSYRTTECEILESFPDRGASITREQGLWLVRESCRRLDEQVSSLRRRYDETLPGDGREEGAANVAWIRNSPTVPAGAES